MTYKYNGLRNLIHGKDYNKNVSLFNILKDYSGESRLLNPQIVEDAVYGIRAIKEKPLLIIYRPYDKDGYGMGFFEDYKSCVFVSGKFSNVDQSGLSLTINGIENAKDIRSDKNTLLVPLDEIIDIIPKENIVEEKDSKLKLFNFYSLDYGEKGHNIYDILHTDPANAYISARYNSNLPLRLSSIRELHAGMQFSKGRGEGSKDIY